ncbi:unnamed protein product [Peronospora farinosa]|uniref:FHA domain-containing protein n=1 Tax=Peronospora farinosa TaxID=134698 RepID=A0ABN8CJ30_9STRA|nr:unnamed protein product [Peronospora farinosa]
MTATQEDNSKPWGRFTLVSKDPAEDSDHIYFTNKVTTIGRNKRRCDLVINKLFISSIHCVVRLDGTDDYGKPIVKLEDNSRNGIWVNADRLGKGASMQLDSGFTVHFTKPGTTPAGVTPMAYKFEFLNRVHDSFLPVSPERKRNEGLENVDMAVVADEPFEATQFLTSPADLSSPSDRKRKRMDEDYAADTVATYEDESELESTNKQLKIVESKLKTTEDQVGLKEGLEQTVQAQVDKLAKENLDLMVKLKASTAENFQLKTDLAAKDKDVEAKIREATTKSLEVAAKKTAQLKEDAVTKEKAMELKIKQSLTKSFEAVLETKSQEMTTMLKEATKKYQQKVDTEHYEERKEISEKMAAFANENEKLHTALSMKDEELAECSDKIASMQDEITALEGKVNILSAKEKNVAAFEEKIAELEERLSVSKDESAEILGLLAAAEEKIVAAEDKAAKADIAAAHTNASNTTDVSEQHELRKSISSLREELKIYRTELARREEEHRKATTSVATAATTSIAAHSIPQGEDADAVRAKLAAALSLFSQLQALVIQGTKLTTMTNSSELHLSPTASAESECNSTGASKSPLSLSAEDGQHNGKADSKTSLSKLKSHKQASTTIEADAASVLAGMTSIEGNGKKHSSIDASTTAADGSDWEMVE